MEREIYIRRKIEDHIMEIGIKPNLVGFDYVCEAIETILDNPAAKMQTIYNSIAKSYFATPSAVERSIRHCIRRIDKYKKTTNSEFIYELAVLIKREVDDESN